MKKTTNLLNDRGLLYGDGFFTTMLVIDNKISNWQSHWYRLKESAQLFGFAISSEEDIKSWLVEEFKNHNKKFNTAKIVITRGEGGKGYQPLKFPCPSYYLYLNNIPQALTEENTVLRGGKIAISSIQWGIQPLLAGIKHLNKLENVMAQQAMLGTDFDENIMLNIDGEVISGTSSSICIIIKDKIYSPKIVSSGIKSTSLNLLAKMLKEQNLNIVFNKIILKDIEQAEEIFFCNSIRGIMPVKSLNDNEYSIKKSVKLAQQFTAYQYENLE